MRKTVWAMWGVLAAASAGSVARADPPAPEVAIAAPEAPAAVAPVAPEAPRAPGFSLEGTSGRTRRLSDYRGRVVILMYEDRDSNQQNDTLKRELSERARAQDLSSTVAVVPVANLSGYDFWPARGYARDAVVDIARQQGIEILIDWSGAMASSYRFRPSTSYVMVLSRDGRVMYRHAGPMSPHHRLRFFNAVSDAMSAAE
ncbi:MAG: hypothetical protein R3A52_06270 [Polyangiales bacterium]